MHWDDPWHSRPVPGAAYRAITRRDGETILEAADGKRVGRLCALLDPHRVWLLAVTGFRDPRAVELSYRGPADLRW